MRKLPRERISYYLASLVIAGLSNRVFYIIAHLLCVNREHFSLALPIDGMIPFLPWTMVIYMGCVPFWCFVFYVVTAQSREKADRLFAANLTAKLLCCLIFIIMPTTMERPTPDLSTFWGWTAGLLYGVDAPDNLFPSIHSCVAWLCWAAVRGDREYPAAFRWTAFAAALGVFASTLTMRQHVAMDILGGIAAAEICLLIAGNEAPRRVYARLADGLARLLPPRREKKEEG